VAGAAPALLLLLLLVPLLSTVAQCVLLLVGLLVAVLLLVAAALRVRPVLLKLLQGQAPPLHRQLHSLNLLQCILQAISSTAPAGGSAPAPGSSKPTLQLLALCYGLLHAALNNACHQQ
jgi:hypothetical protein